MSGLNKISDEDRLLSRSESPFVIFALPRSRTAWLSHWLSYVHDGRRVRSVGHDAFSKCASVEECEILFNREDNRLDGTVETGAAFAYKLIAARIPRARLLVVQRDPVECLKSLMVKGIRPEAEDWSRRVQDLWAVSAAGVRTVSYQDLDLESCARWVWDYCLGIPWDNQWWAQWQSTNVQIDLRRRMAELEMNRENIERLKQEVRDECGAL